MSDCRQLRRKLVRHGTLSLSTGGVTPVREEWVTEPCGVPLFTDAERKSGMCRACASGWSHPENYAVEESSMPGAGGGL